MARMHDTSRFATPPDQPPPDQPVTTPYYTAADPTIGPQPAKSGSCGACTVGNRSSTALALLALLGVALAATGRRKARSTPRRR